MSAQSEGATPAQAQTQSHVRGRSPGVKFAVVVIMTLAMAIPLFMIELALLSREESAASAAADIAGSWGRAQTIAGIYLLVPYTVSETSFDGQRNTTHTYRYSLTVLPAQVHYDVGTRTEVRSRGIYDTTVYTADVGVDAAFGPIDTASVPQGATILWSDAVAVIDVNDTRGFERNPVLALNGKSLAFEPGTGVGKVAHSAIHAKLALDGPPASLALKTALTIRGTGELSFVPLGGDTTVTMRSTWPSPSFFGAFLPRDRRIGSEGFSATWGVPYLARGFGAVNFEDDNALTTVMQSAFGVRFYQPVDFYQLVDRSLKYAILVIGLTFLTFFIFELVAGANLHFIQYAMIGAAQVLFYLLLLSIAEQIGFDWAYGLGAVSVIGLTTAYGISALHSAARAGLLGAILTVVYGALYFLLQVEDYALLIGSLFLFAALAATMYLTRKIDWFRTAPVPAHA